MKTPGGDEGGGGGGAGVEGAVGALADAEGDVDVESGGAGGGWDVGEGVHAGGEDIRGAGAWRLFSGAEGGLRFGTGWGKVAGDTENERNSHGTPMDHRKETRRPGSRRGRNPRVHRRLHGREDS